MQMETQIAEAEYTEADRDSLILALRARYPWAKQNKPSVNLKKELSRFFPSVRFSVRLYSYAGGSSIVVEWLNGPTREEVQAISAKYQYAWFDGMRDCEELDNSVMGQAIDEVLGRAGYVFLHRESEEIFEAEYVH